MRNARVQLVLQMAQVCLTFKEQRPEREDSAPAYREHINVFDWSERLRRVPRGEDLPIHTNCSMHDCKINEVPLKAVIALQKASETDWQMQVNLFGNKSMFNELGVNHKENAGLRKEASRTQKQARYSKEQRRRRDI